MRVPSGYLTRNYKILKFIAEISLRRTSKPFGFTMKKISSRGQRNLICIVKRNTKTDGMGPFKEIFDLCLCSFLLLWLQNITFTNCSCVTGEVATPGTCEGSCSMLIYFIVTFCILRMVSRIYSVTEKVIMVK